MIRGGTGQSVVSLLRDISTLTEGEAVLFTLACAPHFLDARKNKSGCLGFTGRFVLPTSRCMIASLGDASVAVLEDEVSKPPLVGYIDHCEVVFA
jgi:hypothetical protein